MRSRAMRTRVTAHGPVRALFDKLVHTTTPWPGHCHPPDATTASNRFFATLSYQRKTTGVRVARTCSCSSPGGQAPHTGTPRTLARTHARRAAVTSSRRCRRSPGVCVYMICIDVKPIFARCTNLDARVCAWPKTVLCMEQTRGERAFHGGLWHYIEC